MKLIKRKLNVYAKMLILFFVFISITSCNNKKKVEVKNKNGIVVESYFVNKKNPTEKVDVYNRYYDDGKIVEVANYKNGKLNGVRTLFHSNGNKMQEENYIDDKLEGKVTSYFEDGSLQQEAVYKDNSGNGIWKNYFKDQKNVVKEEITIVENKINEAAVEVWQVALNCTLPHILTCRLGGEKHDAATFADDHALQQHQADKGFAETDTVTEKSGTETVGNLDQIFVGVLLVAGKNGEDF